MALLLWLLWFGEYWVMQKGGPPPAQRGALWATWGSRKSPTPQPDLGLQCRPPFPAQRALLGRGEGSKVHSWGSDVRKAG